MTPTPVPSSNDGLLAARQPIAAGRYDEAARLIQSHLNRSPGDARGWGLLGHCLRQLQQGQAAEQALRRSLQLAPGFPSSTFELALVQRDLGREAEAINGLQSCLQMQSDNRAARWELARLLGNRQPELALQVLAPLLQAVPIAFEARVLEAQLLLKQGQLRPAFERFEALHRERPDSVEALEGAYWSLVYLGRHDAQLIALARALAERAPTGTRWLNLAQELQHVGDYRGGRDAVDAALALDPDFLPARWAQFQLPAAPAPGSAVEAEAFCRAWDAGLAYFESIDFTRPELRQHIWACVGQCTAFYRHYLGDEVALQHRYGQLVERMMQTLVPALPTRALRDGRRRIGICSAHLREHTVARLFVPLFEALDRDRFDIHVFSLEDHGDRWSQRLQALGQFEGSRADAPIWRQRIAAAELDVLIYPEVGMHPMVQGLAALRLAPVQLALWGHPVSTGLSTIDGFLTAEALEPADAQSRYSERLLRLPELGHGLREQDLPAPQAPALDLLGEQGIDLLCAQTVYKLLPQQDAVFGAILAALPEARLHLLADYRAPVRDWLRARMLPTLRAAGADPEHQLRIHGFLDHAHYLGLAGCMQLNLDSIGWSGGMSALDLLAQGLPTVCLPGASMRSQQTASLLRRLQVEELIAADAADYVRKTVALARSPQRRADLSALLRERRQRLFGAAETATWLNDLLAGVQRDAAGGLILP